MKGVRALIKSIAEITDIPPQYLYGIVILNTEKDPASHIYVSYDKHSSDFFCGLTHISLNKAREVYDLHRVLINRIYPAKIKLNLIDLFDPRMNLLLAGLYLGDLYIENNDWRKALFIYNTGTKDNIDLCNDDLYVNNVLAQAKRWFPDD